MRPLLALALLLALSPPEDGMDVILLETGGRLKGTIISEDARQVVVRTAGGGQVVVPFEEILEIHRGANPRAVFQARWEALRAGDAEGFHALGVWCQGQGLADEARRAWERAVAIDPEHRAARAALGHTRHEGRWYTREDYNREVLGLVLVGDEWVTPRERDMIEQGFTRDADGNWIRLEDLERAREEERLALERRRAREAAEAAGARAAPPEAPRTGTGGVDAEALERAAERERAMYGDFADQVPWDSAHVHESRHYTVRSNVKKDYLPVYGEMMDTYFGKFLKVFGADRDPRLLKLATSRRSEIWIYGTQKDFMAREGMGQGVGGFYNTGNKRVTAYHGPFGMTGNTRVVLSHEGTHQFEDTVLGFGFHNAPIWLLEGLAVFFESAFFDGKRVKVGTIPVDRLQSLKRGIAANAYVHLPDLIRTPQSSFTAYHYAHAWSFIYMMVYYNKDPKLRERNQRVFSDLFFGARDHPITPDEVEGLFGGREKFEGFEAQWRQYVVDLPYDYDPALDGADPD
ncbi:MAG: DUF1570 domain-containing protein [Planctomycetes bacterium]|nr:DUF1570 domain-containing protein [Planctomycetota bacterium]